MNYEKELRELFYMQQVYATLFSLSNKIQIAADKALGNLSSRQYMAILGILHLPEEEANLNNIAKKLGTSKQNARQLADVLAKKKYVEIAPSSVDKRAVNITVTEAGFEEVVKSSKFGILCMADLFKEFDESELITLWELLKKLYRFDGVEQDGFEAEALANKNVPDIEKDEALKLFVRHRNETKV